MNSKDKRILIVGAGLCGTLLAIRLAQRGFKISLFEKRSDMRLGSNDHGRSINLALSARGLNALDKVGLKKVVLEECIPMRGRMIHPIDGDPFLSPYSGRMEDYINSVSRAGLNITLLNEAEKLSNIDLVFNAPVKSVHLDNAEIDVLIGDRIERVSGDIVLGTDGAGSVVRRSFLAQTSQLLFDYQQSFLGHGYKELSIDSNSNGGWKIHKEALHIWPREDFMIIALPNIDGSFTLTMFHPFDSEIGFNALDNKSKVQSFFEKYYSELLPYIPDYLDEYFENPVGNLGTIKCQPWQAYGKCLILGDASHAIVPFYGQGMNASFEDVYIFDKLMDEFGDNWNELFKAFEDERINDANAIADLAIDNFTEMRDKVDDIPFIRKRKIEMALEQNFKDYYSKYSLVTFRPDLPYSVAMAKGRMQDQLLLEMCSSTNFEEIPLNTFYQKLRNI